MGEVVNICSILRAAETETNMGKESAECSYLVRSKAAAKEVRGASGCKLLDPLANRAYWLL